MLPHLFLSMTLSTWSGHQVWMQPLSPSQMPECLFSSDSTPRELPSNSSAVILRIRVKPQLKLYGFCFSSMTQEYWHDTQGCWVKSHSEIPFAKHLHWVSSFSQHLPPTSGNLFTNTNVCNLGESGALHSRGAHFHFLPPSPLFSLTVKVTDRNYLPPTLLCLPHS